MESKKVIILETNAVIRERYLNYLQDSPWRILFKDFLNEFLEKLQYEKFDLIIAEKSLTPESIIKMMGNLQTPFVLSTNEKYDGVISLPRDFTRAELLTLVESLSPSEEKFSNLAGGAAFFGDDSSGGDEEPFELKPESENLGNEEPFELKPESENLEREEPFELKPESENLEREEPFELKPESENLERDELFELKPEPFGGDKDSLNAGDQGGKGGEIASKREGGFHKSQMKIDSKIEKLNEMFSDWKEEEGKKSEIFEAKRDLDGEISDDAERAADFLFGDDFSLSDYPESESDKQEISKFTSLKQPNINTKAINDFKSILTGRETSKEEKREKEAEKEAEKEIKREEPSEFLGEPPKSGEEEENVSDFKENRPKNLESDVKEAVVEWLEKNGSQIIRQVVLEQLKKLTDKDE